MSVTIECPTCGKRFTVEAAAAGKTTECDGCGTKFQIPQLGPTEEEAPAAGEPGGPQPPGGEVPEGEPLPDLGFAPGEFEPPPTSEGQDDLIEVVAEPPSPMGSKPCPHCGQQVTAATVKCPHCHRFLAGYQPPASGGGATSGLAIASLVCGILSLALFPCCGIGLLCAIPALITGAMAKRQAGQSQGRIGGRGMAIAGLILGILGLLIGGLWLLLCFLAPLLEA